MKIGDARLAQESWVPAPRQTRWAGRSRQPVDEVDGVLGPLVLRSVLNALVGSSTVFPWHL